MDGIIIARIIHVASVVLWIGGVGFVTLVVMPSVRANHPPREWLAAFQQIEGRFAPQARLWVLLAGGSGLYMVYRADMWARFLSARFWWMHAMAGLWLAFMVMLFLIEPFVSHERLAHVASPHVAFARLEMMHRLALAVAVITLAGAVGGSHGLF